MSTTTHPPQHQTDDAAQKQDALARPDISLIDDGHEYGSYKPSIWPKVLVGLAILAVLGGGALAVWALMGDDTEGSSSIQTHTVELENLAIEVTESGTLESAKNLDIKCEVAGGTTILWIVEDGKHVERGERLVELDASSIREEVTQQEIVVERARSTKIQAEKNVEVAKINVREYEQGTFVQELQTLESNIVVAEENLRSAENTLDHTQRMFRKGYATQLELEAQKFAVKRGELDLAAAETAKNVLVEFTKEKMLEDLNSQVATAEATLSSEQKALELEEMKLERSNAQLDKCIILAPESGMVVYANEKSRRGGDETQISEGAAIREQQTILRLPDLSQMQVKVGIHEAKVDTIREGLPANVMVLGNNLRGTVTSIANQPQQNGSWFGSSVKKYDAVVTIDNSSRGNVDLKPGMTAEAKILVANLRDVVAVPNTAVFEGHVWVQDSAGGFEMKKIEPGLANEGRIAVNGGLKAGDVVAQIPATDFEEQIAKLSRTRPEMSTAERYGDNLPTSAPKTSGRRGGRGGAANQQAGGGGGPQMPSFASMDKDGDGFLTAEEVPQMSEYIPMIDANKDGKVSEEEMKSAASARSGKGSQQ